MSTRQTPTTTVKCSRLHRTKGPNDYTAVIIEVRMALTSFELTDVSANSANKSSEIRSNFCKLPLYSRIPLWNSSVFVQFQSNNTRLSLVLKRNLRFLVYPSPDRLPCTYVLLSWHGRLHFSRCYLTVDGTMELLQVTETEYIGICSTFLEANITILISTYTHLSSLLCSVDALSANAWPLLMLWLRLHRFTFCEPTHHRTLVL